MVKKGVSEIVTTRTPQQKGTQGFASPRVSEARKREIHRLGGQAAHRLGKAHAWTSEEAQAAGRKGQALQRQRRAQASLPAAEREEQA